MERCTDCNNTGWTPRYNTYTSTEFVARCICSITPEEKRKPYTEFVIFNPQKYITLKDYEKLYGQDAPPIKDGELADILAGIMLKIDKRKREEVPF